MPSLARALGRGLTLRCPRCGSGGLFNGWFRMVPECPRCRLRFEREPGYWTGALAVNIMATGGVFAIVFVTLVALTVPDVPVLPLLAVLVPIAVLAPIVFYPFSKTIWVAIDRGLLLRLDPKEREH